MQYSWDEIGYLIADPQQYWEHYTDGLLNDLIAALFPIELHVDIHSHLVTLPETNEGLRIPLAIVHLSVNEHGEADFERFVANVELAKVDYRDLLMAYY